MEGPALLLVIYSNAKSHIMFTQFFITLHLSQCIQHILFCRHIRTSHTGTCQSAKVNRAGLGIHVKRTHHTVAEERVRFQVV